MRVLPALLCYPHYSVRLLDPVMDQAMQARDELLRHSALVLDTESDALHGDDNANFVLNDIFWADHSIVRLLFHVARIEKKTHPNEVGPQLTYLAKAINTKLPDEKSPEDVHQHIRDCQRSRRHKHLPLATIYDAQVRSKVL